MSEHLYICLHAGKDYACERVKVPDTAKLRQRTHQLKAEVARLQKELAHALSLMTPEQLRQLDQPEPQKIRRIGA